MFKGAFFARLRERPFDFYTAAVIFLVGLYALVDPDWPENTNEPSSQMMITLVSLYMIIASSIVMASLSCNKQKRPVLSIAGEMWGWLAISAASFAVTLMYISQLIYSGSSQLPSAIILTVIWFGMAIASALRSLNIFLILKGYQK